MKCSKRQKMTIYLKQVGPNKIRYNRKYILSTSDNIELNYNFSYDRDLDYSNYDSIKAKFGKNKFITSFDYITRI